MSLIGLFPKCICGNKGDFIVRKRFVCRKHFDEMIKAGNVIPPSHYVTEDGYKLVSVMGKEVMEVIHPNGKKGSCRELHYQLVKA
ncbi:hypothetical protein ACFVS2_25150 [Brevibacillus sp. NPDC058079]|uniref:hypothetical protein n=1 Tax=Brevibacillus sp. NPDC058079 TaxID=3346330 RepID=UPI0036E7ABE4